MENWNYENEQWNTLPPHLKHLPLFTRHFDLTSSVIGLIWAFFLKVLAFGIYIRIQVKGDFKTIYKNHPRLLLISNHSSHLDATSIAAAVPYMFWKDLYISAAKDYWFKNPVFTFFSKHCLGAIPIDRKEKKGESIQLCLTLLKDLKRIWLILFPEGTRSADGYLKSFKKGVSVFSQSTKTPILFLYIKGNSKLWPKGKLIPRPGTLQVHVGPVHDPAPIDVIREAYKNWVLTIDDNAICDTEKA